MSNRAPRTIAPVLLACTFISCGYDDPADLVAVATAAEQAVSECPPPTVADESGACVLHADATLDRTLRLSPGMKLDCRNHHLTPQAPGVLDDPRTVANELVPSQPELAVLGHGTSGTVVERCRLGGFDFGIHLIDVKRVAGTCTGPSPCNAILDNQIDVRASGIGLTRVDDTLVAGNTITYASERGRGVVVDRDSDENQIVDNIITSTDAAGSGLVRLRAGGALALNIAVLDNEIQLFLNEPPALAYFIIDAHLPAERQLILIGGPGPGPDFDDATRTDHNVVARNRLVDRGFGTTCAHDPDLACTADADCPGDTCLLKLNSGVAINVRASQNTVRDNTVIAAGPMRRGLSIGGGTNPLTVPGFFPGTCELAPSRICATDADCNIVGWDASSVGPCVDETAVTYDGRTVGNSTVGNRLTGTFEASALFANSTVDFTIRRNTVHGDAAIAAGIRIEALAVNGLIERNVVRGAADALFLEYPASGTPSMSIELNNFTKYEAAIRTTNDYDVATKLGANYWGLRCPGFPADLVLFEDGQVNPAITGGAYGMPVASIPDDHLPAACP